MDEAKKKAVTQRLASAAGHIKGIERMVQEDEYCIDVIRQIQAVQAALNRRRGRGPLPETDVKEIERCTRDPHKLHWPRRSREQ